MQFIAKNQLFQARARFLRRSWWGVIYALTHISGEEMANLVKNRDSKLEFKHSVGIADIFLFVSSRRT